MSRWPRCKHENLPGARFCNGWRACGDGLPKELA